MALVRPRTPVHALIVGSESLCLDGASADLDLLPIGFLHDRHVPRLIFLFLCGAREDVPDHGFPFEHSVHAVVYCLHRVQYAGRHPALRSTLGRERAKGRELRVPLRVPY